MFDKTLIFFSHPATLVIVAAFIALAVLWRIFGKRHAVLFSVIDVALGIASFALVLLMKGTLADMLVLLLFAAASHLVLVRTGKEDDK